MVACCQSNVVRGVSVCSFWVSWEMRWEWLEKKEVWNSCNFWGVTTLGTRGGG